MRIQAYYTIEVRDKKGRVIRRFRRRSHSYVKQFIHLLNVNMGLPGNLTTKDITGADRALVSSGWTFHANGAAAEDDNGIIIGLSSTAVSISDHKLILPITEGTGLNQMNYGAVTVAAPTVAASKCSFTVRRVIVNASGATITVAEIGIYCEGYYTSVADFLVVRDVLLSSVDVADGGAITVEYTIYVEA